MDLTILLGVIGPTEVILLVVVVVLLFGGKKLPELMKGIGQGMKDFKNAVKEDPKEESDKKELKG